MNVHFRWGLGPILPGCSALHMLLQGKQTKKAPYSQYGSLKEAGAQIVWGDPASPESLPSTDFDVVIDNNGKTLESCKPLIDAFKVRAVRPQTSRVSSCRC